MLSFAIFKMLNKQILKGCVDDVGWELRDFHVSMATIEC